MDGREVVGESIFLEAQHSMTLEATESWRAQEIMVTMIEAFNHSHEKLVLTRVLVLYMFSAQELPISEMAKYFIIGPFIY